MNIRWLMILALLLMAGCSDPADVATADKKETPEAPAKVDSETETGSDSKAETEPETKPAESEPAETAKTETKEPAEELTARTVLDNAIAKAKADDKALFVHFSADW